MSCILFYSQIIYARDAVVGSLMDSHAVPSTKEESVEAAASLTSLPEVSIDDVTLTEVSSVLCEAVTTEGLDSFTSSLGREDARLLVEVLKLAVAGRAGENGKEALSSVLKAMAQTHSEVTPDEVQV